MSSHMYPFFSPLWALLYLGKSQNWQLPLGDHYTHHQSCLQVCWFRGRGAPQSHVSTNTQVHENRSVLLQSSTLYHYLCCLYNLQLHLSACGCNRRGTEVPSSLHGSPMPRRWALPHDSHLRSEGCLPHSHQSICLSSFSQLLAGLLARQDLVVLMDKTCDDLWQNLSHKPSIVKDIWDAELLWPFKGPCRQKAFVDHQGEGHFMFALHIDFFNMQGNLQCNATTLCGIISCACLNLPLDSMQYKPENMYLAGIIPGLCEPSADQLNHFLDPLISNMVDSWERGVEFSHTASHTNCVTRSAVACAVCNLPAARKTAQLAAPTSHFYCSTCHCYHLTTLGKTDMDAERWSFWDKEKLRSYAQKWWAASVTHQMCLVLWT